MQGNYTDLKYEILFLNEKGLQKHGNRETRYPTSFQNFYKSTYF